MPSVTEEPWLRSESACEPVAAHNQNTATKIWFKKVVDEAFCHHVTQLQLSTDSYDQGYVDFKDQGSWTWFELVILANESATEPKRSMDGKELAWPSHSNRLCKTATRHFGAIFDRRSDLLVNLEVGDVLAVRVCAKYPGWVNFAESGFIVARLIEEDLFIPHRWPTLGCNEVLIGPRCRWKLLPLGGPRSTGSTAFSDRWTLTSDVVPEFEEKIEDGSYSFVAASSCFVESEGNDPASKIWFTSSALDQSSIDRFEAVQLFTSSRCQKSQTVDIAAGDSFSWFDIVILETPFHTAPRVVNGVSLVWKSHANRVGEVQSYHGRLYDIEEEDDKGWHELAVALKGALKEGNAIGVRVNAQYPGWENYARAGQLIIRISNQVHHVECKAIPDVRAAEETLATFGKGVETFYSKINYKSATIATLSSEARADATFAPPPAYGSIEGRPLRLLSIDGGGVRGVASLRILKKIMAKVAKLEGKEAKDVKPCDYFDMIAGTSTGGLIAIMLGRLQMSIEECEKKYENMSTIVFGSPSFWAPNRTAAVTWNTPTYKAEPLEKAVKSVVNEFIGSPNAPMFDPGNPNPPCKVLVMSAKASPAEDAKVAVHLRNYATGQLHPSECKDWEIWEAARATSAAPTYFPRFKRDNQEFIDGGLGFNNPTNELLAELRDIYGNYYRIGCLVSLGTGAPATIEFADGRVGLVKGLSAYATNSELLHNQLQNITVGLPLQGDEKYWRFNLSKGTIDQEWLKQQKGDFKTYEKIMEDMDQYEAIQVIQGLTDRWLERSKSIELVEACATRIASK